MKFFVTLSILFTCFVLSEQVAQFINCSPGFPAERKKYEKRCLEVTCLPTNSVETVGCPVADCIIFLGFKKGDPKKEYPDCCNVPICSNNFD